MSFLAPILPFLSVASTIFSAFGSVSEGNQQASNLSATAEQYRASAMVNDMNAKAAVDQAAVDERNQRLRVSRLMSEANVGYAKSGVTMSGTPLLVQQDSAMQGELDALTIRYQGTIKSNNYKQAAASERASALSYDNSAKSAKSSSRIKAVGTLLGGAAYVGSQVAAATPKGSLSPYGPLS